MLFYERAALDLVTISGFMCLQIFEQRLQISLQNKLWDIEIW